MAEDPRPDRPFVVEARPARPPGRSRAPFAAFVVAVVAIVGLSGWGLLAAPGPRPSAAPPTDAPRATLDATPVPTIGPSTGLPDEPPPDAETASFPPVIPDGDGMGTLVMARVTDALAALGQLGGWGQCPMWRAQSDGGVLTAAAVAAALHGETGDGAAGMHVVADTIGVARRVWVGGSLDDAVRGFGGTIRVAVTEDPDGTWTGIPEGAGWAAVRLDAITGSGIRAWYPARRAVPAPYCGVSTGGPPATVIRVSGATDPLPRLFKEAGWDVCRTWQRSETTVLPSLDGIDAAADAAGIAVDGQGWVTVPVPGDVPLREQVWLGSDAGEAGTQHGGRIIVVSHPGDGGVDIAWVASSLDGRPYAALLRVATTRAGRTAWIPLEGAAGVTGTCPLDGTDPVPGDAGDLPGPTVEVMRGVDPLEAIATRFTWDHCQLTVRNTFVPLPDGAAIDAAADAAVAEGWPGNGWLAGDAVGRVWIGADLVEVARAANAPLVAYEGIGTSLWFADDSRADEWTVVVTPAGRTAWVQTGSEEWPEACPARPFSPPVPMPSGIRSFACHVDRPRCVEAIEQARTIAPAAFAEDTDVAVGGQAPCLPRARCVPPTPAEPVLVTAWRNGAASHDAFRTIVVGPRSLSGVNRELRPDEWSDAIIWLAARPSLDLVPVSDADAAGAACPAAGVEGILRGSPWDPRVAWVGSSTVRWPPGTTARFVPELQLVDRFGAVYDAGATVQVSGSATGDLGFVGCRITLVESVTPVPSSP